MAKFRRGKKLKLNACPLKGTQLYQNAVIASNKEYVDRYWLAHEKQENPLEGIMAAISKQKELFKEQSEDPASKFENAAKRREVIKTNLRKRSQKITLEFNKEKARQDPDSSKLKRLSRERESIHYKLDKEDQALNKIRASRSLEYFDELYERDRVQIENTLGNPNASETDIIEVYSLAKSWEEMGNFDNEIFFSEDELNELEVEDEWRTKLSTLSSNMEHYTRKIVNKYDKDIFKNLVEEAFDGTLTDELRKFVKSVKDLGEEGMNWLKSAIYDISESKNIAFQTIKQLFKKAINSAHF